MTNEVIEIDGSKGEGGGQIFRTALAYASVIKKPVIIRNIRKKRKNPGLRPQHLAALEALKKVTNAEVKGNYVSSETVFFKPRTIEGGHYVIDVKTAGSVTLIIQAILPTLLFAKKTSEVIIKGGTDVPMAPPIDSLRFVFIPFLKKLGLNVSLELIKRGHYPRGGGEVKLFVKPIKYMPPIELLKRGDVIGVKGISHAVKLPAHVAERQARAAEKILKKHGIENIDIEIETYKRERDPHRGPGSGIVLWAETSSNTLLEADSLGARGKPAEKVGEEAALSLIKQLEGGGAVDVHHTDQLIIFMALAQGESTISSSEISLHTLTAIDVAKTVLGSKFSIDNGLKKPGIIKCEGIGVTLRD